MVEYRDVPGFPGYRVGNDGSVWSCRSRWAEIKGHPKVWRRLKCKPGKNGYPAMSYWGNGKLKRVSVHTLVLLAFVGPRPKGMECRHLDGCKTNNRVENLAWGTPQENHDDMARHGTRKLPPGFPAGALNPRPAALLTEAAVREIIQALLSGEKQREVAKRFKVSEVCISSIRSGRSWGHLLTATDRAKLADGRKKHGRGKLTAEAVREIRQRVAAGEKHADVARDYYVSKSCVTNICARRIWREI